MQSTPRFIVTGVQNSGLRPEGAAPPKRLNIVDFVKDERMFSLYVQALQEMYRAGEDDVRSYYQLAGIHGLPYVPWNGDPNKTPAGAFGGYCTHGSLLFPTWHRPYVLAFEQVLQSHAVRIAEEYTTETSEWRQAAAELRQPFWDWAAPGQAVPPDEVIRLSKVFIRATPDGKRTEIENPLFTYKFKSIVPGSYAPFDEWLTTLRHPKDDQSSDPDALARVLSANQESLTSQTCFMFILLNTWPEFSNTRASSEGSPATSLEGIHNAIHNFTGGGGHMGDIPVAAFDPIFYMHHANVDRCLSLWAALHPDVWVTEDQEDSGTFALPDNATINAHTSLSPFANSPDTYWTSNGTMGTTHLGYTYPEFEGLDMNDRIAVRKHIAGIVIKLYYMSDHFATSQPRRHGPVAAAIGPTPTAPGTNNSIWEWSARVRVKHFELDRSFHVLIFLGSVPEDPNEWHSAPSYVGSFSAFVNGTAAQCANCQTQIDLVTEGYVHLRHAIAKHDSVSPFDPDCVKPYLKDFLHWRVQMADGTPIPLERLPSLEVTVAAVQITGPGPFGGLLPVPVGETVLHHDITSGRLGGARPA